MQLTVVTVADDTALAVEAAGFVASRAGAAVTDRGQFTCAVSGGKSPWAMFAAMARMDVPWEAVQLFQVDERVAPDGDPDRNLTHLRHSLERAHPSVVPMPVDEEDLDAAADRYAALLPARFDLIHLGLGADGHTASLVPDDPVLQVTDRLVALTQPYQGHRRMTLTYPALARTEEILWLVSGADKREALTRLLDGDRSMPAACVEAARGTVLADTAAAGGPPR